MSGELSRRTVSAAAMATLLQPGNGFAQNTAAHEGSGGSALTSADKLAKATVRMLLANGQGDGTGFHFIKPEIIVSNAHVVGQLISGQGAMTAHAETGEQWNLKLLAFSPPEQSDYAIMRASGAGFDARMALTPSSDAINGRGQKLLYAGHPHGIDPLLVHSSEVTAPLKDNAFFFSGMVHGGNSGGPVVADGSLGVLGIVTKRRFFGGPQMQAVDAEMKQLQDYLTKISSQGTVAIMGVNFSQFALVMSRIASLTNEVIRTDSTTGIGVANSILPVIENCKALKLL